MVAEREPTTGGFNHAQRATLAAWATKTALLLELALAKVRGGGFAPQRHFRWLYRHRDHLEPPPRTTVWMFGVAIGAGLGAGIHWTQLVSRGRGCASFLERGEDQPSPKRVSPDEKSMELLAEWLHAPPQATVRTIPASPDWQPPS